VVLPREAHCPPGRDSKVAADDYCQDAGDKSSPAASLPVFVAKRFRRYWLVKSGLVSDYQADRDVAIKVLAAGAVSDPGPQAAFRAGGEGGLRAALRGRSPRVDSGRAEYSIHRAQDGGSRRTRGWLRRRADLPSRPARSTPCEKPDSCPSGTCCPSARTPGLGNPFCSRRARENTSSLRRISISAQGWQATGAPERLTLGTGREGQPSVASGSGRVVFASLTENADVWRLPLQPNDGKVTGEIERLTSDGAMDFYP
jgi:hypothetical protein